MYPNCCRRLHSGTRPAVTVEELMRSRYAAFAVADASYLLRTWHPTTRPSALDLPDGRRWIGLSVLEVVGGTAFHQDGTVEFEARYVHDGQTETLHERSRFVRHDGRWCYLDAEFAV